MSSHSNPNYRLPGSLTIHGCPFIHPSHSTQPPRTQERVSYSCIHILGPSSVTVEIISHPSHLVAVIFGGSHSSRCETFDKRLEAWNGSRHERVGEEDLLPDDAWYEGCPGGLGFDVTGCGEEVHGGECCESG